VVCLSVIDEHPRGGLSPLGLSSHEEKTGTISEEIFIITLCNDAVAIASVTEKKDSLQFTQQTQQMH